MLNTTELSFWLHFSAIPIGQSIFRCAGRAKKKNLIILLLLLRKQRNENDLVATCIVEFILPYADESHPIQFIC